VTSKDKPYDWNRIATESALVGHLERLGGKIIDPKKTHPGFAPGQEAKKP
jgi:hypothetical protein